MTRVLKWLEKILTQKQRDVACLTTIDPKTLSLADGQFYHVLHQTPFSLIAEMKKASPSEGVMAEHYNPAQRAKWYQQGGATAISVLTDQHFFQGDFSHITAATQAVDLPVLCKDFIIDAKQVYHARAAGAQAVLLIVRILDDVQLEDLLALIEALGMTALVEIFDTTDLARALAVGANVIGINNRNLDSLATDTSHSLQLAKYVPSGVICLSLSGVKQPQDVVSYTQDCQGVLLGTAVMRAANPAQFLQDAQHSLHTLLCKDAAQ